MGLFDAFFKKRQSFGLSWVIAGGQVLAPEDRSTTYIDKGYKYLPNVYSIISLILQKSSIVPFEVYKVKNKGKAQKYKAFMKTASTTKDFAKAIRLKNEAFDKIEGSDLEELLLKPNPKQSTEELFEEIDGYLLLTGNSYIWGVDPGVGKNAKIPKQLHALISPTVSVVLSGDVTDPVKAYKVTNWKGQLDAENVAHLKMFNPLSSVPVAEQIVYGHSPLASCRLLLGKYADADKSQWWAFKNQGIAGVLSSEAGGDLGEEQARAIQDRFNNFHTGTESTNKIVATSASVRWNKIGLSPVDLGTIQGKEEILGELCNVYHVPIGMFTKVNSTENNMVESRKMFITDAVIPLVEKRKSALNRWLAPKFGEGLFIEFDYTVFPEMNEDMEKLVSSANQMDWVSQNEKRAMTGYDMHPDPLMDKIYMQAGKVPIEDMAMEQVEPVDEDLLNA